MSKDFVFVACSLAAYFRYAHSPKLCQQRPCSHRPASCGTGSMISISTLGDGTSIPASSWIGEFKNGRGELFGQESFNGRTIFVRFVWSDITPNSHHVEQSFSDDGGKTWQPNFVATLTRDEETSTGNELALPSVSSAADGTHDFDFNFGVCKTHIHRLQSL